MAALVAGAVLTELFRRREIPGEGWRVGSASTPSPAESSGGERRNMDAVAEAPGAIAPEGTRKRAPKRRAVISPNARRFLGTTVLFSLLVATVPVLAAPMPERPTPEPEAEIQWPEARDTVESCFEARGVAHHIGDRHLYVLVKDRDLKTMLPSQEIHVQEDGSWTARLCAGDQNATGRPYILELGVVGDEGRTYLRQKLRQVESYCAFQGDKDMPPGFLPLHSVLIRRGAFVETDPLDTCALPPPPAPATRPWADFGPLAEDARLPRGVFSATGAAQIPQGTYLCVILYNPSADSGPDPRPYWVQAAGIPQSGHSWGANLTLGPGKSKLVIGYADEDAYGEMRRWMQRNDDRNNWTRGLPDYPVGFTPVASVWVNAS